MEKFIIDDRIFNVKFSCDLVKCKGACCTLKGAGGAPLLDSEIAEINASVKFVKKYLSNLNIDVIESAGFLEGSKGDFSLASVNDEECVFAFYDNDVAKCSFEKAYFNGEIKFRKPVSCHLFPIRIKGAKRNILRYEEISECSDALQKGEEENLTVFEFARESLEREYGKEFYRDLNKKFINKC
ncbi:MAG: DUF3109 family protein [bacterium]|nr:DUF3109 family protein [bacterium]